MSDTSSDREVFVYGTLLLPELQRRVTGRELEARTARVAGFARRRVRGERYPSLVPQPGAWVEGALLRGVDAAALARLDAYEGDAYERIGVRAVTEEGREVDAWAWLLSAAQRHRVGEEPWDLATFVARDLARFAAEFDGLGRARDAGVAPPEG